jgi:hypothetical protein
MFQLLARKYWVPPGINISTTTVAEDPNGIGAFAPPEGMERGMFVGTYLGKYWREISGLPSPYCGTDDYVMEDGVWRWTPKRPAEEKPNLGQYPMAALQEPPYSKRANCTFKSFTQRRAIGLHGSQPMTLVAVYTTERIQGNSELFVHYGNAKKRSYEVSDPALPLALKDISPEELPRCWVDNPQAMTSAYRPT